MLILLIVLLVFGVIGAPFYGSRAGWNGGYTYGGTGLIVLLLILLVLFGRGWGL